MAAIKSDPDLASENEKTLMKMAMPFTKFMMDKAATAGPAVLDVKLPFGEASTLAENVEYMLRALKLEAIDVQSLDNKQEKPAGCESICPGNPVLVTASASE